MFPVTPVWIVSFPLALWARRWLTDADQKPGRATETKSWGATTMMFVRETRWSRVIAAANILAIVAAVSGFAVYKAGWFWNRLDFRIVATGGEDYDRHVLYEAMRGRLSSMQTSIFVGSQDRMDVYAWGFNADEVVERLRLQGNLKLVWLEKSENDETIELGDSNKGESESAEVEATTFATPSADADQPSGTFFPLAAGIEHPLSVRGNDSLGAKIATVGDPVELEPNMIATVDELTVVTKSPRGAFHRRLEIGLTGVGRKTLADSIPANRGGLGLVIDGLVYAYADPSDISNDRIIFQLTSADDISPTAITAALQGPDLPAALLTTQ
jgi:hypothetical protein